MKNNAVITLITSAVMIALFLVLSEFRRQDDQSAAIKAGFLYVSDSSTAYTKNFMEGQKEIEDTFGDRVQCVAKYNVSEENGAVYIQQLLDEGCSIIFGTSYGFGKAMKEAAQANPQVEFCQATCSNAQEEPVLKNYHTFMGHIYEGRYVSGVAAGLKMKELLNEGVISEDQALAGYVAAYPAAEVISGYTAFLLGIRSVCPEAKMIVRYTNTWGGYIAEKECAEKLIAEGCVIISQHSDTKGPAAACENAKAEHPVYLLSYNQNMIDIAPTCALTGCRINWAPYEIAAVRAVLSGKDIEKSLPRIVSVNGRDAGAGFSAGWIEMLDLNKVSAAPGTEEAIKKYIRAFETQKPDVFRGDYTGTDPLDGSRIDLSSGYQENANASAPSFHYVLDDVIRVED